MSSADSDSSDGGRKTPPLPRSSSTKSSSDAKTKKKKKLAPQEKINEIWERFSAPQFSKATTILPFATPTTKSSPDPSTKEIPKPERTNLLVSEDFERAVQECRKRVQKLIKECRRVNMRYRDPDFDIDWDLKWDKGNCLNGLGRDTFKLSKRSDSTSNVPKSVKRVHEIFDKPTFLQSKISPADLKQGGLGNCWQIGSLTALANMEGGIQRICVEYDCKIGIYGFVFCRDGDWIVSIIDDKLYLNSPDWDSRSMQRSLLERTDREDVEKEYRKTYQTGSQCLFFAQCRDQNETWLPLLEKAYAKAHGDYAALEGGWSGEGLEDLTGGVTTELLTSDLLDTEDFWTNEIMKVNKEFLFGCYTGLLDGDFGHRGGICERHAYVLMEARELSTGQRLVKLRNPWGKVKKGVWEGAWSDGSKEFTPEIQLELNHKFGADSVFWISYEDFLRKYQHLDRTRLFMDSPEWRVTQKWISVEVPWKAEFEQKFKIVLTKESPIVLVLSQIDHRYFKGLQGQYDFRLQFRLHEINSPDENDYIVHSHGNYLMERSVVTELKSLAPGTYSIFIKVVADRKSWRDSVEDVIKYQTRKRTDNEKLASVGMSYDLAHSKAVVHLESNASRRTTQQKAKARETRNATRRKDWQKRHLSRKITRKQEKKNREKLERRQARVTAAAKLKADEESKDQCIQTEDIKEVIPAKENRSVQTEDSSMSSAILKTTVESQGSEGTNDADKAVPADDMSTTTAETAIKPQIPEVIDDTEKGVPADDMSVSDGSQFTPDTPNGSSVANSPGEEISPLDSAGLTSLPQDYFPGENTSPPPTSSPAPETQNNEEQDFSSDGESSASPVSDFGDLSSDEPTPAPTPATDKTKDKDEEEDDGPEPWNAICIVGLRVYSQDEGLCLKIYGEDEVEEDEKTEKVEMPANDDDGMDADVEDEVSKEDDKHDDKQNEKCTEKTESKLPTLVKRTKRSRSSLVRRQR